MAEPAREHHLKHRRIYEALRQAIVEGVYHSGDRMPTEAELVKQYGVSRPTVVRAYRDLEQEGLLQRRRGSGTFVRKPKTEATRLFGVMISGVFSRGSMEQSIFSQILGRMCQVGQEHGCSLLFPGALQDPDPARQLDEAREMALQCLDRAVDGVFLVPLLVPPEYMPANRQIVEMLTRAGRAVVLLDRDLYPYPRRSGQDLVALDNFQAGLIITRHLLEQGARRIDFVGSQRAAWSIDARLEGYRVALQEAGVSPQSAWVHQDPEFDTSAAGSLASSPTDAFLCYNDDIAAFLQRHLLEAGRRIPQDVRLAGFDDSVLAPHLTVPLTTVAQPWEEIGQAAIITMLERVAQPNAPARTVLFAPRLVVRQSA